MALWIDKNYFDMRPDLLLWLLGWCISGMSLVRIEEADDLIEETFGVGIHQ